MVATWFRVACHETLIQNSQIAERTTLYFFAFRLRKSPLKYNSTNNSKKIYTNNTDNNNNKIEPFHTKHAANSALHLKRNKNIQKIYVQNVQNIKSPMACVVNKDWRVTYAFLGLKTNSKLKGI